MITMKNCILKNSNRGSTTIAEMLVVLGTTATVMVGGVALNTDDITIEGNDAQKVANVRQLATALEMYYFDHQTYPQGDFATMLSELSSGSYLASLPTGAEDYTYQDLNGGGSYVLRALLDNPASSYFQASVSASIGGFDCTSPYYCIRM